MLYFYEQFVSSLFSSLEMHMRGGERAGAREVCSEQVINGDLQVISDSGQSIIASVQTTNLANLTPRQQPIIVIFEQV